MFLGVKLFEPDVEFVKRFGEDIDFIEVMAIGGKDYSPLSDLDLPFVIHNEHFGWGVNFANPKKKELNRASIECSIKWADRLGARHIIVHPERVEDESCTEDALVEFLSGYDDERIIVESMPYFGEGYRFLGYDLPSIERILERTGRGMCLDFAHSSESAAYRGVEPLSLIKELMGLNPRHFHMSDTRIETLQDLHLHLKEGNLPLEEYRSLLPKDAWVTLETEHTFEKTKADIRFLKEG